MIWIRGFPIRLGVRLRERLIDQDAARSEMPHEFRKKRTVQVIHHDDAGEVLVPEGPRSRLTIRFPELNLRLRRRGEREVIIPVHREHRVAVERREHRVPPETARGIKHPAAVPRNRGKKAGNPGRNRRE